MSGMRVLDIGNAEGFFSFEAERRGAAEVVGIENYPPMARKFEICRAALGSRARTYMVNVYDLNPGSLGNLRSRYVFRGSLSSSPSYSGFAKGRIGMHRHSADADRDLR